MIISIDSETYEYNKKDGVYVPVLDARKFALGCAIVEGKKSNFFYDHNKMWDFLIEKIEANIKRNKRTFIYAHNMEYDWYAIAKDNLLNPDIKYICFNPFIAIYKGKGYFLDSMAFYKMSLQDAGKIIGYEKGKMPIQVKNLEELKVYLQRDTEIVYKLIIEMKNKINKFGFNPRKLLTAGQLAITSFLTYCRRNELNKYFMEYDEKKRQLQVVKSKFVDEIREAFRGGMNQCLKTGKFEDVTLIDANGLYAYIMTIMDFPDLKSEQYVENPDVKAVEEGVKKGIGIARVTINAPSIQLPFLPTRFQKYTVYAGNRKLRGTWTFIELRKAIELGYKIEKCEWFVEWNKSKVNPLKGFILELYEKEMNLSNKQEKLPLKLLRNNLYGKFAQFRKNKTFKIIERKDIIKYLEEGYEFTSTLDAKYIVHKEISDYEPSYVNPIISTLITANARTFLYENMRKVSHEDLLYCDTDSIAFKGNHIHKFKIGNGLGEWKIEAKGKAKFLGEKRYYIDDKPKISGLMKREISVQKIEEEKDIETKRMIGLKTGLLKGNMGNVGGFVPYIQEMKVHNKLMLTLPDTIDEVRVRKR